MVLVKNTTINMLMGALLPDKGNIYTPFVLGNIHERLSDYKQKIEIVPQELAIYEDLSALQNVRFFASLYNIN